MELTRRSFVAGTAAVGVAAALGGTANAQASESAPAEGGMQDGLWIGPGLDAQTAISTSYTPGLQPDSAMRRARGYLVEGGAPRLVRLVSADEDDEDKEVPR